MSANDRQVAGTHYMNGFQHWDFAAELGLGYYEGQITKYITRHKAKKGQEDVEKCLHFTQKLRELHVMNAQRPIHKFVTLGRLEEYAAANKLSFRERMVVHLVCEWTNIDHLNMVIDLLVKELNEYDKAAEPGPGYVNQGADI